LGGQLTELALHHSFDATVDGVPTGEHVPALSVIAIGEDAHAQHTKQTTNTVDADGQHAVDHHARIGFLGPVNITKNIAAVATNAAAMAVRAAMVSNWISVAAKVEAALKPKVE